MMTQGPPALSSIHLSLLLILQELQEAKYLWKRIPVAEKEADQELAPIWEVGLWLFSLILRKGHH